MLIDVVFGALFVLLATSLGALAVLVFRCIDRTLYSMMLSFSAGIMGFSVIEMLLQSHASAGDAAMLAGLVLGVGVLFASDKVLPHLHARIRRSELAASKKKAALLAGAITMHNVPEGLSVGAAFASSTPLGWLVAFSIGLQDVPEGLLVSAPLACYGINKRRSVGFGILSGVVEAVAAVAGYAFLLLVNPLVPIALSFSAGAMLYVIFAELVPDAFTQGLERTATLCFIAGFAVAFLLAAVFSF